MSTSFHPPILAKNLSDELVKRKFEKHLSLILVERDAVIFFFPAEPWSSLLLGIKR